MRAEERRRLSKRLSYVLRHAPEAADIRLDAGGWVPVESLLGGDASKTGERRQEHPAGLEYAPQLRQCRPHVVDDV